MDTQVKEQGSEVLEEEVTTNFIEVELKGSPAKICIPAGTMADWMRRKLQQLHIDEAQYTPNSQSPVNYF